MLFASIAYFFKLIPEPEMSGNMKIFKDELAASIYLMPLAKVVELICDLCFITGKFMKITAIVLLPVSLNILLILTFMNSAEVGLGAFLFLGNIFFIYKIGTGTKVCLLHEQKSQKII